MSTNDTLTQRQRRFVAALFATTSVVDAAAQAGVCQATGWRYLRDERVLAELARLQDGVLASAAAGLASDLQLARQTLRDAQTADDVPWSARVSAARAILEAALRLVELASLARRLSELEANDEIR